MSSGKFRGGTLGLNSASFRNKVKIVPDSKVRMTASCWFGSLNPLTVQEVSESFMSGELNTTSSEALLSFHSRIRWSAMSRDERMFTHLAEFLDEPSALWLAEQNRWNLSRVYPR